MRNYKIGKLFQRMGTKDIVTPILARHLKGIKFLFIVEGRKFLLDFDKSCGPYVTEVARSTSNDAAGFTIKVNNVFDFQDILDGSIRPSEAYRLGKMQITGEMGVRLPQWLLSKLSSQYGLYDNC